MEGLEASVTFEKREGHPIQLYYCCSAGGDFFFLSHAIDSFKPSNLSLAYHVHASRPQVATEGEGKYTQLAGNDIGISVA